MFSPNGWMGEKTENSVKMVSFLCSYCHAIHAYVYIHVLDNLLYTWMWFVFLLIGINSELFAQLFHDWSKLREFCS